MTPNSICGVPFVIADVTEDEIHITLDSGNVLVISRQALQKATETENLRELILKMAASVLQMGA